VEIDIKVTKRVLAAELGTVAETLSRTLSKFRQEGWIEVNGRLVTVQDPAALNTMLRRHLGECS
jgi:CRP-like cAMP-binding protein